MINDLNDKYTLENGIRFLTGSQALVRLPLVQIRKDKKNNAKLPITEIIDKYYSEVQKNGGKRWDTSSLISLLI